MNHDQQHEPEAPEDRALSELLHSWQIAVPTNAPGLAARVWRRIEARPASATHGWRAWLDGFSNLAARPAFSVAAVVVFIFAGVAVAELQNDSRREERLARFAAEYVRSIDPVLMTGAAGHVDALP